ncbi:MULTISPECIES: DUF881 domain-containing protein [unclassified Clostridioides]|uniref:DUF881 domain-containing protein n=1 Tax=unclassified Clostridioides TaxID=2635829 RepID=UPI001D0C7FC9|nr:DUF881 domain-containing protein [Clostridioides sp. ES-S-0001-02]MCC0639351.1 DUF881 domain-containing protein [Clostridioides sp. ES-S-0049-03]MCC0653092.1 DUF881 domain-containing protein [Clostridioides sp. ES-S-0001-03]MCC0656924.1 DUF881 domain-containing protein [Clostridioides sp. ES-S-0123-01]MCC0675741.1 DUF881 domain-containing protein [Clostridioides sp. ES-W-0018-02]MCC0695505.1 DUF881 domain-containing protein [Clostridioides sp. ES-S-0048-02]MCC0701593.1 DUF881 domain-contai
MKKKMIILGAFILGIFISTYIKSLNPNKVYITLSQTKNIESEIENTNKEIKNLKEALKSNKKTLDEYKQAENNGNESIQTLMKKELEEVKELSGYSAVTGPGITITMKDSERELKDGQNPNDLIIHDIDILRVLNDLKKAGAKAISINGERVLSTSKIKCSGATITVNDTTYGQPFIIKAIGDIDLLSAAINSPESYAKSLKDIYGINIKIEENNGNRVNLFAK